MFYDKQGCKFSETFKDIFFVSFEDGFLSVYFTQSFVTVRDLNLCKRKIIIIIYFKVSCKLV